MKNILTLSALITACVASPAWAMKSCDELKAEITTKIESHGGKNFALEVVAANQAADKSVVGSCEGGKKKITYVRKAADKAPA